MKRLGYNISVNNYTASQVVPREKNCNGFMATNIGDTAVTVNGKILFPSATPLTVQGDSVSIGGNEEELYLGLIRIAFALLPGLTPQIEIIQKFYLDPE